MSDVRKTELAYRLTGSADNFKYIRHTSDDTATTNTSEPSPNRRGNRQLRAQRVLAADASGDFGIVFESDVYDAFLQAAFCSAFTGTGPETLKIGEDQVSFDILKIYEHVDGTTKAVLLEQMHVDTFSLEIGEQSYITGSIGFVGADRQVDYDLTGITIDPIDTGIEYDASNNMGAVTANGSNIGVVKNISFEINNNHSPITGTGSQLAYGVKQGNVDVTGSVEVVMTKDMFALYKDSINNIPVAIGFPLDNGSVTYDVSIPRAHLTLSLPSGDQTDVITISGDLTATYTQTDDSAIVITKTTV